jgi:hypothetical protein
MSVGAGILTSTVALSLCGRYIYHAKLCWCQCVHGVVIIRCVPERPEHVSEYCLALAGAQSNDSGRVQ